MITKKNAVKNYGETLETVDRKRDRQRQRLADGDNHQDIWKIDGWGDR